MAKIRIPAFTINVPEQDIDLDIGDMSGETGGTGESDAPSDGSSWPLHPTGYPDPNEPGISLKEKNKRQMMIDRDFPNWDGNAQPDQDEESDPGEDPDPNVDIPPGEESTDPVPDPIPSPIPAPPPSGIQIFPLPNKQLTGVNFAGAEFTPGQMPGIKGQHYYYPALKHLAYWEPTGINVIRYCCKMARLFNEDNTPRDLPDLVKHVGDYTNAGYYVVVDVHDYANQFDYATGKGVTMTTQAQFDKFAAQWRMIAAQFASDPKVVFGIMNEPQGKALTIDLWFQAAQAAVSAIREVAGNHILIPGINWANASLFPEKSGPTMKNIVDPLNNFSFEGHQYSDQNNSGGSGACVNPTILVDRIDKATLWARDNGFKFFLGEFAAGDNDVCHQNIANVMEYLKSNSDVWVGWTVWGAGRWWPDSYHFNIGPIENIANGPKGSEPALLQHYKPYFTGLIS